MSKSIPAPVSSARRCLGWRRLAAFCIGVVGLFYYFSPIDEPTWAVNIFDHFATRPLTGKRAEKEFLKVPDESSALSTSRHYTSKPHIAGSAQDLQTAKDVLSLLQTELGIEPPDSYPLFDAGTPESRLATLGITTLAKPTAWIDTYYPVLNTPLDRTLEIIDDAGSVVVWSADLTEHVDDDTDLEAFLYADDVPTFHGLSRGGTAQGQLVYANLGRKQDYDGLVASGVDFNGKVVIVRYGGIFRGLKVKFAQELGAVAVLIYSDPRDDGSVTVANGYEPYPHGPARNPTSVQRGSVQFLSLYPGDPTTPGYPSYPNATRTDGTNIPKIPSLPISWANAQRLLDEITHLNQPSERTIKLVNNVDDKVTPIWNTMAVIPGHIKNEVVFLGNHRDAWVLGGADPTSGTVSLNEVIKGYGALLRKGWRPLRTIMIASWDAEEYGLIGSTEYGEDFTEWIGQNVVAYVNLDVSVSGSRFHASASPSLADLVRATAEYVAHPTDKKRSLWDARLDSGSFFGPVEPDVQQLYDESIETSAATGISALGSGSDYTVFLQRIGVASIDQGFSATLSDAVYHYHSIYDSQYFQETYADKGFHKHVAVAKHIGLLGLRLSDSIILPINTTRYCSELESYVDKVESISRMSQFQVDLKPLRQSIAKLHHASVALDKEKHKAEKHFLHLLKKIRKHRKFNCAQRIWDFMKQNWAGPVDEEFRHSNSVVTEWAGRTPKLEKIAPGRANMHGSRHSIPRKFIKAAKRVQRANQKLASFERGFISSEGIKDREWYKHLATAPGKNLGYGATTLPALTESITIENNSTLAKIEVARLEKLLTDLVNVISLK